MELPKTRTRSTTRLVAAQVARWGYVQPTELRAEVGTHSPRGEAELALGGVRPLLRPALSRALDACTGDTWGCTPAHGDARRLLVAFLRAHGAAFSSPRLSDPTRRSRLAALERALVRAARRVHTLTLAPVADAAA